ncbi:MAG TPA: CCA tRNA nucleotidyltransferase [Candidatus Angelobacter sp.]|nr:CCA tRNA nucleotidyltransferase [Candidatus Angelobacter sp.]
MELLRVTATEIVRRLQKAGFQAFWVGGSVRDFLLGREPDDYDIVTSALPEQIEALFPHTIAVGRKFGVIVVIEDEHQFQVATFRAEADYQDGRHPEHVRFGDARADAERRDFTVNGLFFDPVQKQLHDWVGGEKDLSAKIIRTIGSPGERFAEDHLRLLRAVRLATQLDFEIEAETFRAIQANAAKIKLISAERIRDELVKLFAPLGAPASRRHIEGQNRAGETPALPGPARGLILLRDSGLLEHVLPEVAATIHCDQSPDFHPEGSVFNHLVLMLTKMPADAGPLLPWAILMHDIAKPLTASHDESTGSIHFYEHERIGADMTERILERLRFPRKQIEAVVQAVRCHMQFKDALQMRKATLRRLLMRPTFPLELQLHRADCLGSHGRLDVYDFLVEQSKELEKQPEIIPPLLNGNDLQELGMKAGPALGALLHEIRDKQLQEELKTPADARAWAKEQIKIKASDGPSKTM